MKCKLVEGFKLKLNTKFIQKIFFQFASYSITIRSNHVSSLYIAMIIMHSNELLYDKVVNYQVIECVRERAHTTRMDISLDEHYDFLYCKLIKFHFIVYDFIACMFNVQMFISSLKKSIIKHFFFFRYFEIQLNEGFTLIWFTNINRDIKLKNLFIFDYDWTY